MTGTFSACFTSAKAPTVPLIIVSPYAKRKHVDHNIYGFESILKLIRYRYGLAPLTVRDQYAKNIARSFDFESKPNYEVPDLPDPPSVVASAIAVGANLSAKRSRTGRWRERDTPKSPRRYLLREC